MIFQLTDGAVLQSSPRNIQPLITEDIVKGKLNPITKRLVLQTVGCIHD